MAQVEVEEVAKEVEGLEADLKKLDAKIESQYHDYSKTLGGLVHRLPDTEKNVEILRGELNSLKNVVADTRKHIAELEKDLRKDIQELQKDLEEIGDNLAHLAKKVGK